MSSAQSGNLRSMNLDFLLEAWQGLSAHEP
jgi:hypothetical protein